MHTLVCMTVVVAIKRQSQVLGLTFHLSWSRVSHLLAAAYPRLAGSQASRNSPVSHLCREHQHRNTVLWLASTWDLGIQTQALHWQENLLHAEPSPQTPSYFCAEDWTLAIRDIRQVLCYGATSLAINKHCQCFSCDAWCLLKKKKSSKFSFICPSCGEECIFLGPNDHLFYVTINLEICSWMSSFTSPFYNSRVLFESQHRWHCLQNALLRVSDPHENSHQVTSSLPSSLHPFLHPSLHPSLAPDLCILLWGSCRWQLHLQ